MAISARVRAVLLPAAVFQSVIFGGAYGTGREIAEFVSVQGPRGGLAALAQIALVFAVVAAISFELARTLRAYDYRTFFRALIGRGWIAYEVLVIASIPLVVAVNGSAAGAIMADQFDLPATAGVAVAFATVVLLSYLGRRAVEQSLMFVALALVLVLSVTTLAALSEGGEAIRHAFSGEAAKESWSPSAIQYSMYNVAVIPIIIFCARNLDSVADSILSGIAAAVAGVLPALVFHITFMTSYPAILEEPLPIYSVLQDLAGPGLFAVYVAVLGLMIISTVGGLLQGLNERVDAWHTEIYGTPISPLAHATASLLVIAASLALSGFGITALIAEGYGALGWAFMIVYVLPLLVLGPARLAWNARRNESESTIKE